MAQTANTSVVTKQILAYYDEKLKQWTLDQIDDGIASGIKAVDYANDTLKFYKTEDKSDTPIEISLPEEQFLDQAKTTFVENFTWSAETYPSSTNPNLDGKPVLVLAVKGEGTSVSYSFVNLNKLVDIYTADETSSATVDITDNVITADVKISAKTGNIATIVTDEGEEGIYVPSQQSALDAKADKVTGATAGNFANLDANGNLVDSGVKEADFVKKTTTIAGVDLQDNVTKDELLEALNVEDGAQVNIIETVKVNGTALDVASKAVDVTVATGSANGTIAVNGADVAVKGYSDLETTVGDASNGLVKAVADNKSAIDLLNGADTESGSVAYAVKQLADGAVKDNADAIDVLNGDDTTEGSVAKAIKDYADAIEYANTDDVDALFATE